MTESVTYRSILAEGHEKGLREGRDEALVDVLLLLGNKRFGPPDAPTRRAVQALRGEDHLRRLIECLDTTATWADLLAVE